MAPDVGQLRTYLELGNMKSMTDEEKALAVIVTVREYSNCGQPINQAVDFKRPSNLPHLLQKLRNLACWELMLREYGYDVRTVGYWLKEAMSGDGVWSARWATDQLLKLKMSNRVTGYVVTVEAGNVIARDGVQDVEAKRFNDLLSLLEGMLNSTREFLRTNPNSRIGIEELLSIVNESDIVCMGNDFSIRLTYRDMRNTQRMSHSACYKVISGHLLALRRARKHCAPIENAIRIMLQVIPQLDWETLQHVGFGDWCEMLTNYGFAAYADTLERYILRHKDWLDTGGATPLTEVSRSLRTPAAILPLDPRPSLSFGSATPGRKSDDDDDDDHFSTPGSKELGDVMLSAKHNQHRCISMSTFHRIPSRLSKRSTKRTPELESNESDSSQQSTPRPMKRVSMTKDTIDKDDSDLFEQATPRPIKRAQMDMGTFGGALVDVESGRDHASRPLIVPPTIEGSDPVTVVSPSGRADKGDTEKAAGIKDDEKLVMMWVDGAETIEAKDHFENNGLIEDSAMGDTATAARGDANADIGLADNKGQEQPGGSGKHTKSKRAPRKGDSIETADAAIHGDSHKDNPAGDHDEPVENDDQPSESNPTKWQDAYAEYHSWPRDLKIYDDIGAKLINGIRKDMLECLSQGEENEQGHWWDCVPADCVKRTVYALEFGLKIIRAAVDAATNQQHRKGKFKTLAEEIDLDEEGVRYDQVMKAIFTLDPKVVSHKHGFKTSEEEEEDDEENDKPTKWRDTYAEYKTFPRKLRIFEYPELRLFNKHRLEVPKSLSRAEARGKECHVDRLGDGEREDLYAAIEHDLDAIRRVIRRAAKRKRPSGPVLVLADLIDHEDHI